MAKNVTTTAAASVTASTVAPVAPTTTVAPVAPTRAAALVAQAVEALDREEREARALRAKNPRLALKRLKDEGRRQEGVLARKGREAREADVQALWAERFAERADREAREWADREAVRTLLRQRRWLKDTLWYAEGGSLVEEFWAAPELLKHQREVDKVVDTAAKRLTGARAKAKAKAKEHQAVKDARREFNKLLEERNAASTTATRAAAQRVSVAAWLVVLLQAHEAEAKREAAEAKRKAEEAMTLAEVKRRYDEACEAMRAKLAEVTTLKEKVRDAVGEARKDLLGGLRKAKDAMNAAAAATADAARLLGLKSAQAAAVALSPEWATRFNAINTLCQA